jgi:hypothetical protein
MPVDNVVTQITGSEPTYSAREAAAVLKRSYSWLDQRLRRSEFVRPDGTAVEPLRSPGGYRYFTVEMLRDITAYCYRHRWFSFDLLQSIACELAAAECRDTGDDDPQLRPSNGLVSQVPSVPLPICTPFGLGVGSEQPDEIVCAGVVVTG